MTTETKTQTECAHCGCELDLESEGLGIWDKNGNVEDVCSSCYDDHVLNCQLCGADMMPHEASPFIVVKVELANHAHPNALPGIYRVRSRPFLTVPMIGALMLHSSDLLFIDVLPKPDKHYDISGHVCRKCAKPYSRIYGETYGQLTRRRTRKSRGRRVWWLKAHDSAQSRRITAAFTKHPERLMDLECDPDDFADEYGHFVLPRAKTYHDYVVLRRNGVTVYDCYPSEHPFDSWLLLRPEPRYRNMCMGSCYHNGKQLDEWVLFSASGLPTWKQPKDWPYHSMYEKEKAAKQAIIDAIDQGILRQNGVFDATGKPILCR